MPLLNNICLVAALLGAIPAFAQKPPEGLRPGSRSPMALDVAGVRLAMPIRAARVAAEAASYACTPFGREASFEEQVEREVIVRRGGTPPFFAENTSTAQLDCVGPAGEALTLRFASIVGGEVVDYMRLQIDPKRVDQAAIRRQVAAKYGRPTLGTELDGAWCDPGYRCGAGIVFSEGPLFTVDQAHGLKVMATRGGRAEKADKAAVAAEAARRAPAKSRAAF